MSDELTARQKLRVSMTDDEWAAMKASEPGGGGGPNSKYFGGTKKQDFHLFGTDLFGDEIKPDAKGALHEKFEFPPFSVLNAREGAWQTRKRAWLSIGIKSELGRGATPESYPNAAANLPDGQKGLSAGLANNVGRSARAASPGDNHRPAMDYSNREKDDGSGKALRNTTVSSYSARALAGGFEDSGNGSSGTSIFDPVLTELSYRWFCPEGGLILDPFAGGSVRGLVAGLLGFRYHGIDLRPEQVAANEAQRAALAPEAAINWACGDSNVLLKDAPEADFVFSCPPYGDLEQYSDDPNDLSTMTWEQFNELYASIIKKAVERLKPNRFASFVVGEYRDKKSGMYRGFVPATIAAFEAAGAQFYNEAILITAVGSLPIRITKQFESGRKLGKALCNGSLIPTSNGFVPIEALKEGDHVFSSDGEQTRVTGVYPQGQRSLWSVTFSDGTNLVADSDHLWFVEARDMAPSVMTTAQILTRFGARPKGTRPWVPTCQPVQIPAQAVPLDPYLLGVLLGDGTLGQNTPSLTSSDAEIVTAVRDALPPGVSVRQLSAYDFILAGTGSRSLENPLTTILRELGVMGKGAKTKFVPDIYLWNETGVRLQVLRGLLDTDGGISGRNGTTEFSSISKQLADDVAFLARSLGARVKIKARKATTYRYKGETKYGQPSYRVRISGGPCPFKLARKAEIWSAATEGRTKDVARCAIVSIEKVPDALATCISVEHSSGLFLTEHFIVTHNTHQNVLSFCKGDPKLACDAIRRAAGGEEELPAAPKAFAMPRRAKTGAPPSAPETTPRASARSLATAARPGQPEPPRPAPPAFVKTAAEEPKKPSALSFALERKANGTQGADRGLGGATGDATRPDNPLGTRSDADGAEDRAPKRDLPFDDVRPEIVRRESEPPAVAVSRSTPATWPAADVVPDAEGVRIWLRSRGYKVVRAGDEFTVEDSDAWEPEDFAWFCNLDADVILGAVDPPWKAFELPTGVLNPCRGWGGAGMNQPIESLSSETATPGDPRGSESGVSLGQGEESSGALAQVTPPPVDGGGGEVAFPAVHAPESAPPSNNSPTAGEPDDGRAGQAGSPSTNGQDAVGLPSSAFEKGVQRDEGPGLLGFNAGDASLFDEPKEGQTRAQFLGHETPRVELSGYVPDEPPDLSGVDEVVLNFATSGLDWHKGARPGGVTVASMDGRICCFLPFGFLGGNLDEARVKAWAKEQLRGKKIYNANTKFDLHMARIWGVDLEAQGCTFSDIQHTAALLDDHTKQVKLDVLGPRYLPDLPSVGRVDERRHLEHHAAEVAERERYTANLVWRLRDVLYPQLAAQELMAVQRLEDDVIPAVVLM